MIAAEVGVVAWAEGVLWGGMGDLIQGDEEGHVMILKFVQKDVYANLVRI